MSAATRRRRRKSPQALWRRASAAAWRWLRSKNPWSELCREAILAAIAVAITAAAHGLVHLVAGFVMPAFGSPDPFQTNSIQHLDAWTGYAVVAAADISVVLLSARVVYILFSRTLPGPSTGWRGRAWQIGLVALMATLVFALSALKP